MKSVGVYYILIQFDLISWFVCFKDVENDVQVTNLSDIQEINFI